MKSLLHTTYQLNASFPIGNHQNRYGLSSHYFCANECFDDTIDTFKEWPHVTQPASPHEAKTVSALLIGESHLLSIIPELAAHGIELIICADIDPFVLIHIQHLLSCLAKSSSRSDFKQYYYQDFPTRLIHCIHHQLRQSTDDPDRLTDQSIIANLYGKITNQNRTGSYNLSFSEERFLAIKMAFDELTFVTIMCDLFLDLDVGKLSEIIKINHLHLSFINLTNVHDYDDNDKLTAFLKAIKISQCSIQYSTFDASVDSLTTHIVHGAKYEAIIKQIKYPFLLTDNKKTFFYPDDNNSTPAHCAAGHSFPMELDRVFPPLIGAGVESMK